MKKYLENFKRMNLLQKILFFVGIVSLLAVFVFAIMLLTYEKWHYYGSYILIGVFSIPTTFWSFSRTLNDIRCAPELIKIKATIKGDDDKKIDAYFDILEKYNFSLLAPFICLGMTIASFFIYTKSAKGMLNSHYDLFCSTQIALEIIVTLMASIILLQTIYNNRKNHLKLIFKLFLSSFIVGSVIASFYNITTLLVLAASLFIGLSFNNVLRLFTLNDIEISLNDEEKAEKNKENNK